VIRLVAFLINKALALFANRAVVAGGIGVAVSDIINLDWLRQEAIKAAPGSDAEAIEESARTAARLLGLEGDEVLWPRRRDGNAIVPRYLTIDLARGRAWYSSKHYSYKSARMMGRRRSWGRRTYYRGGRSGAPAVAVSG